jgi:hypothetical protein
MALFQKIQYMGSRKGKLFAYFIHTPVASICFERQTVVCDTANVLFFGDKKCVRQYQRGRMSIP